MRSLVFVLVLSLISSPAYALTVDDAVKLALSQAHGNVRERGVYRGDDSAGNRKGNSERHQLDH